MFCCFKKAKDGSAVCIGRLGKIENGVLTKFLAAIIIRGRQCSDLWHNNCG